MNYDQLRKMLIKHEDRRTHPYECTAGKQTIGVGHNLTDNGLPDDIIDILFERDIAGSMQTCTAIFQTWRLIPDMKQVVLADMAFQLGHRRLIKFKKMIKAVNESNWEEAANEMLDSKWARDDTPDRANELAAIMRS